MPQHPGARPGHVSRRMVLAPLAATALLLAACAAPADQDAAAGTTKAPASPAESSSPPGAPSPSPSPGAEDRGPEGPDKKTAVPDVLTFTATTSAGRSFDGASLAGEPVLLWFWAPWCAQCRSQIPDVRDIAAAYDGRVQVVGVGSLDDAGAIKDFAAEVPGVTHLVDDSGAVWRTFGVLEQSSFVLLDAGGEEVLRSGYGDRVDLRASVENVAGDA